MTAPRRFETFVTIEGDDSLGLVLVADHARRDLPAEYGSLGLPEWEFQRHIAYDIGVEAVTRKLATLLGAPAVMAGFSRLLIDPNRGADDPTLIRQLYDGTIIPGNYPMSDAERERRLSHFYRPYHAAVWERIAAVQRKGPGNAPFIVSIHSFTPEMQGRARPWHAGILWDSDDRAVRPLMEMLCAEPGLIVGDNEPYDGALKGDTMYTHAIRPGFAHLLIEIRQDLIADETGQEEWANRMAPMLDAINRLPDIHVARHYGSRTGSVEKGEPS
ncbi:MAG: N-formylglutamate amidohydrolase [Phyllobacteriaceae bacterium]|nr:N-formylglutamate amidohydrolase [Phyllobacteriaceae bacterium]MBA92186.1 N-formylglutamate amidohydrolase [Phyllobacteriaceae bacterium]